MRASKGQRVTTIDATSPSALRPIENIRHIRHSVISERKKMNFIKIKSKRPAAVPATAGQSGENHSRENHSGERPEGGDSKKYVLDTIGQVCPFPLVEAKRAIGGLRSGDELQIDFDCTQATDSIPAWASAAGHAVTDFRQIDKAIWTITLRKA